MKNLPLPEYNEDIARYRSISAKDIVEYIKSRKITIFAVDTETHYDERTGGVIRFIDGNRNNTPFGASITVKQDGEYISFWVTDDLVGLRPILEDESTQKILHNAKYDMHMLKNLGIDIKGQVWDTMVMIHLIDEEHWCNTPSGTPVMSKALKNLAYHYLGENGHYLEDLVSEARRVIGMNSERVKGLVSYYEVFQQMPTLMKDYACSDTEFTYKLFELFIVNLMAQDLGTAYDTDIKATYAVFMAERVGIKVDMAYFNELVGELDRESAQINEEICQILPVELNVRSSRDLVEGFAGLGVEWVWFTGKGELQTDDKVLKQFTEGTPARLASLVLKGREVAKLRDTFISQIRQFEQNGRVHANFNVCPNDNNEGGTVTGRISSSAPNLHNLPKDDNRIRKGLIPTEGFMFLEMDYDQQEYRLLAHYAKDENFFEVVRSGKDVHIATAEMMFGLTHAQASEKKNRGKGKTMNFAMVYGLGLAQLAMNLGLKIDVQTYNKANGLLSSKNIVPWDIPAKEDVLIMFSDAEERRIIEYYFSDEARTAIKTAQARKLEYFSHFPDIQQFLKDCAKKAKSRGWVKTWTGRRRHFHDAYKEGYKGPNAVIQGGCGDVIKQKMYQLEIFLTPYQSRVVNNIHDALLFELHKSELFLIPEIKAIMEDLPFSVPITVGIETSEISWGDLEKCETYC